MAEVTGTLDRKMRAHYIARRGETTYDRTGEGFESFDESLNPQTTTTNYINGKTSNTLTSYQETWAVNGQRYVGDKVNDLFAEMAEKRVKGPEAQLSKVDVNLWEESATSPGSYRAFQQNVIYAPESAGGGAATDPLGISGSLSADGEVVEGTFTPATPGNLDSGIFTPDTVVTP